MRITEAFFKIPIKIYDKDQVGDLIHEFEHNENLKPSESIIPAWVQGWKAIPFTLIKSYCDDTADHKGADEIRKDGFDATFVHLYDGTTLECLWRLDKFEEKLNDAYNRYLEGIGREKGPNLNPVIHSSQG